MKLNTRKRAQAKAVLAIVACVLVLAVGWLAIPTKSLGS